VVKHGLDLVLWLTTSNRYSTSATVAVVAAVICNGALVAVAVLLLAGVTVQLVLVLLLLVYR
jgi:hypothetical protein